MNPGFYPNMGQNVNNQNMNMQGQNINSQNMNMWGQNPKNQNMNNTSSEFLDIIFYYKGAPIHVQSTSDVRFCDLYKNKFTVKAGNPPTPPSFYFKKARIDSTDTRTLKELNIDYQATIQAADDGKTNDNEFLNIIFNCQGKIINLQATKDTKICDLSKKFCTKAGY